MAQYGTHITLGNTDLATQIRSGMQSRRQAITQFQATLGIIQSITNNGLNPENLADPLGISAGEAAIVYGLIASVAVMDITPLTALLNQLG